MNGYPYEVPDFRMLRRWSHIMWDIDGTITDKGDVVNQAVAAKIINLALHGVFHSFITGRDAGWVKRNVIEPMKGLDRFPSVRNMLFFLAESGCVTITIEDDLTVNAEEHDDVKEGKHVIRDQDFREALKQLVWDPAALEKYASQHPRDRFEEIFDADGRQFRVSPRQRRPKLQYCIWNDAKKVVATFEKIRDARGRCVDYDLDLYEDDVRSAIKDYLRRKKLHGPKVEINISGTAMDVVPRAGRDVFNKGSAAGRALERVRRRVFKDTRTLREVVERTVAFGDGESDFRFIDPVYPPDVDQPPRRKVGLVFVGDPGLVLAQPRRVQKSVVVKATGHGGVVADRAEGAMQLEEAKGAGVASAVLDFLKQWDYLGPFSTAAAL